jgi:methylated-DNA-[protein]-cysteine S-methyltransferase
MKGQTKKFVMPMNPSFSDKVYDLIMNVPKGQTISYGEIAKRLKSSPRAVGQALKRNPYAPEVPCHRVIHSDGRIGGYSGVRDSDKKVKMLRDEGIKITVSDGKAVKE